MCIGPAIVGYGETVPGLKPDCLCEGLEIGFAVRPERIFLYLRIYGFAWKGHAE